MRTFELYSGEAEKAVLGSMLARPETVIPLVREKLTSDSFFIPAHKLIAKAIVKLTISGMPVDLTTTHQALVDMKKSEEVGSPGILADIASGLATHLNVGAYIKIVYEKWVLRKLQDSCAAIVSEIENGDMELGQLTDFAEREIYKVCNLSTTNGDAYPMSLVMDESKEAINNSMINKGKLLGLPTGFKVLDHLTCGWQSGQVIVIAGLPGEGKSVAGIQMAKAIASEKTPVGIITLEMSRHELAYRFISGSSDVRLRRIRTGELDVSQADVVSRAIDDLATLPVYFEDVSCLRIHELASKCRRLVAKHECKCLIIDYLQLLSGSEDGYKNRVGEIDEICKVLKGLAKELGVPIIELAQLNRKAAEGQEPKLSHLRESGGIEASADIVILLHRNQSERSQAYVDENIFPTKWVLAKQRNGPTGEIDMILYGNLCKFKEAFKS